MLRRFDLIILFMASFNCKIYIGATVIHDFKVFVDKNLTLLIKFEGDLIGGKD